MSPLGEMASLAVPSWTDWLPPLNRALSSRADHASGQGLKAYLAKLQTWPTTADALRPQSSRTAKARAAPGHEAGMAMTADRVTVLHQALIIPAGRVA